MAAAWLHLFLHRTLLEVKLRAHKAHQASIALLQALGVHFDRALGLRILNEEAPRLQRLEQQASLIAVQNQDGWQQPLGYIHQIAPHNAGAELGPRRSTGQQRWGEPLIHQWQAIAQRLCGIGLAMQTCQLHQTIEQRVRMGGMGRQMPAGSL